jgi:hypothetical protein
MTICKSRQSIRFHRIAALRQTGIDNTPAQPQRQAGSLGTFSVFVLGWEERRFRPHRYRGQSLETPSKNAVTHQAILISGTVLFSLDANEAD